jgi:lipase ATG15
MISVLPATLYLFISRLLGLTDPPNPSIPFYLRHAHAIDDTFGVVFQDVPQSLTARPVSVGIRPIRASRPRFSTNGSVHQLEWDDVGVPGPDVESRETLLELAKMTYNAYNESPESDGSWYELESQWNTVRAPYPASYV